MALTTASLVHHVFWLHKESIVMFKIALLTLLSVFAVCWSMEQSSPVDLAMEASPFVPAPIVMGEIPPECVAAEALAAQSPDLDGVEPCEAATLHFVVAPECAAQTADAPLSEAATTESLMHVGAVAETADGMKGAQLGIEMPMP